MTQSSRLERAAAMLGLMALYSVFMLLFLAATRNPWPIYAFLWLLAGRLLHVVIAPADRTESIQRAVHLWAISVTTYVLGAIATILLPLPPLGVTPDVISLLQLHSSGAWSARPHTVLAFGTLYFAIQAWAKFASSEISARGAHVNGRTTQLRRARCPR